MKAVKIAAITVAAILVVGFLITLFVPKPIADVKSEEYVGETVRVRGEVTGTIKFGSLSGYTLTDKEGDSIMVSSEDLPEEGSKKSVSGTIKKGPLGIGYYLEA